MNLACKKDKFPNQKITKQLRIHKLLDWITRAICLCLFLQILISQSLWLSSDRSFPMLPAFENLPFDYDPSFNLIMFVLLMLGIVLVFVYPQKRFLMMAFFIVIIFFLLQDINRLQVWVYLQCLLLFILFFRKEGRESYVIKTLQLVIIGVYLWSGLNKFNAYFVEEIFPWFLEQPEFFAPLGEIKYLAYFIAAFELMFGVGLLIPSWRKFYIPGIISFHLLILLILGPFGHNWNEVVWPWNILMISLVILLFEKRENLVFGQFKRTIKEFPLFAYSFLLVWVFPMLNSFGNWDEQLSFKMYSGINPEGVFYFYNSDMLCFPPEIQVLLVGEKTKNIVLDEWSFKELKVAPYISQRTFLQMGKKLCECLEDPELGGLKILRVERWSTKEDYWEEYKCKELLEK